MTKNPAMGANAAVQEALMQSQALLLSITEGTTDAVFVKDTQGRYLLFNAAASRLLQKNAEQVIGQDDTALFPAEQARKVMSDDRDIMQSNQTRTIEESVTTATGNTTFLTTKGPVRAPDGTVIGLFGIARDITERKLQESALEASEKRMRTLVEHSPYCIHEIDLVGRLTSMNGAGLKMMGVDDICLIQGTPYLDAVGAEDRARIAGLMARAFAGQPSEFTFQGSNGMEFQSTFVPIKNEDGVVERLMGLTIDITDQRLAQAKATRMWELLEHTGKLAKVGGWELDVASQKLRWTAQTFRIADIDSMVEPPLEDGLNLFAPHARPIIAAAIQATIDEGTPYDLELPILTAKGQHKWVQTQGFADRREGRTVRLFGTFQDITERKHAQELLRQSEERRMIANDSGRVAIWEVDIAAGKLMWDDNCFLLYRLPKAGFTGNFAQWQETIHPEDRDAVLQSFQNAVAGRGEYHPTFRILWPDGTIRYIEAHGQVLRDADGVAQRMIGTNWDITDQKQNEIALQASLRDKDGLLKEVHHRVKNNLQVISSLLRMESRRSTAPEVVTVLKAMQGRIYVMAQLHQSLYRSGTFASVDLGEYLRQIASQAFQAQLQAGSHVQLKLDMGSVPVGMDQGHACGLLVNELVSNGLRHGFVGGHGGDVRVSLQPADPVNFRTDPLWRLSVSDTGVGLPPDFEDRRATSLGLQLVEDLAKQVGGTLTMLSQPGAGAEFSVVFPAAPPAPLVMPA